MDNTGKKRVLVVDDASLVRKYCRAALEKAGFEVDEALNGAEALEKVLTDSYDLLIVDINMPQMDGMTFLKALRRNPMPVGTIPALVSSTEAMMQDRAEARLAGANFYLVKPVTQEMLVEHALLMSGARHG